MIPREMLILEQQHRQQRKNSQGNYLSHHFQLKQIERSAVFIKSYSICRYHAAIFEKSYSPRQKNHAYQRPVADYLRLLELQMAVPGKSHKYIGYYEEQDSYDSKLQHDILNSFSTYIITKQFRFYDS